MALDIKQYGRSFTFTESAADENTNAQSVSVYENAAGKLVQMSTGDEGGSGSSIIPFNVKYTYYQETPVVSYKVGGNLTIPKAFGETAFGSSYNWTTIVAKITSVSVSDEIVRFEPPSRVVRLWEVIVTAEIKDADDTTPEIKQYGRSFAYTESAADETAKAPYVSAYEDVTGTLVPLSASGGGSSGSRVVPVNMKYTYYQETPTVSYKVGDNFTIPTINKSAKITSVSVSDEIIRFDLPNTIVRLWEVTIVAETSDAGDSGETGEESIERMDLEYSEEINGSTERTVSGRLVVLLNSATPKKTIRVTAIGAAQACPYKPNDTYSYLGAGLLVKRSSSKPKYVTDASGATRKLYTYTIEGEI
jgi:hypothetical protein